MIELLMGLAALAGAVGPGPDSSRYAEGQVWEYRARQGEEGSLLKIQRIERLPARPDGMLVYHVSIIGVLLGASGVQTELPHAPVSTETLDASVTSLSTRTAVFPDVEEGIAQWRSDEGGVFTISVAEIVSITDDAVRRFEERAD
jgi:hypothetical protein